MSGAQYCAIKDLRPDLAPVTVIGLIIAKSAPRHFQREQSDRGVITVTIRDELRMSINCSIWGGANFVDQFNEHFKIGDVITIFKPIIRAKNVNNNFAPNTYSHHELTFNDGTNSRICRANADPKTDTLMALANQIYKPTTSALKLSDVACRGNGSNNVLADFVVAVRFVYPLQIFQKPAGERSLRKVIVMDESLAEMTLNIWHGDYLASADGWTPYGTILHLVDADAGYERFESAVSLKCVGRTVIVVNPTNSSRAAALQQYVDENGVNLPPLKDRSAKKATKIDVNAINEVYTIAEMEKLLSEKNNNEQITGLVYAIVTNINVNRDFDDESGPISKQCGICKRFLKPKTDMCNSLSCMQALAGDGAGNAQNYVEKINVTMELQDHTGTWFYCYLRDEYAEQVLGENMFGFKHMSEEERQMMHDKFWLMRFGFRIVLKKIPVNEKNPKGLHIEVVDCLPFDFHADAAKLKL